MHRTIDLKPDEADRFWSKVDCSGGPDRCWPYLESKCFGYGIFSTWRTNRTVTYRANRIAYFLEVGDPGSLCVLHRCDNRPCCNPAHLFLGTRTDNSEDKVRKNRQAKGERISSLKLSEKQVLEIRFALAQKRAPTYPQLAKIYGVSNHDIYMVAHGYAWGHIGGPRVDSQRPKRRGEEHGRAVLTEADVLLVRKLAKAGSLDADDLAARFGVQRAAISKIIKRRTWRHI